MKKKVIAVFVGILLVVGLAACTKDKAVDSSSQAANSETVASQSEQVDTDSSTSSEQPSSEDSSEAETGNFDDLDVVDSEVEIEVDEGQEVVIG